MYIIFAQLSTVRSVPLHAKYFKHFPNLISDVLFCLNNPLKTKNIFICSIQKCSRFPDYLLSLQHQVNFLDSNINQIEVLNSTPWDIQS